MTTCFDTSQLLEAGLRGDPNAENRLKELTQDRDTRIAVCAVAALRELQIRRTIGGAATTVGGVGLQVGTSVDPGSFGRIIGSGIAVAALVGLLLFAVIIRPRTGGR